MVEDNKQLAARIDNSIHAANEEVSVLREELVDTNRRLSLISEAATADVTKVQPNNVMASETKRDQPKAVAHAKPNNDCKYTFCAEVEYY